MSEKEQVVQLLDKVPDYKMGYVLAYVQGVIVSETALTEETAEALKEVEEMKKNPEAHPSYHSFQEILDEVNGDV